MRLGLCFQGFLALLQFLILKTFNLKYLVGERYKGWISQPPLSVYSSVIKHLALASMPCSLWRVMNSWYYRLNFLMMDDMCFYIKNDHATVELLNYSHKIQSNLVNGVHQTKFNVNLPSELCHYYLEAKGNTAYYQCLIRVIMIVLIMRIVLNQSQCL